MQKTTLNATEMKRHNRSLVLMHVREQGCSRIEIARQTGLTRAAISVIVEEMLQEGILLEGDTQENAAGAGAVGRRATQLILNAEAFHILGLNIARSACTLGLTDFSGAILHEVSIPIIGVPPTDMLARIDAAVDELLKTKPCGHLLGMGVIAPGPLDTRRGMLLDPPNFDGWHNIPLVAHFSETIHSPVLLENNSAALALAEKSCGIGKQHPSFLAVIVDTGIGGGLITQAGLYKGNEGFGCEVGHTSICYDGPQCTCGNHGCAELYASIPNIVRYAQSVSPDLNSWSVITDAAAHGREDAQSVIDLEAEYIACMVINALQVLDVSVVVFFGDICDHFEQIGPLIAAFINERAMARSLRRIEVYASALKAPTTFASANLVLEAYIQAAI